MSSPMSPMSNVGQLPIVLAPVETPKPWGRELWLNATRPEGRAVARDLPGAPSLAELLAAEPALLGEWAQRLYGDELPIFTKFIQADFPPLVHVGFNRPVERPVLLGWLAREQALLRQLLGLLRIGSREAFTDFAGVYSTWATAQAATRWRRADEHELAAQLQPFVVAGKEAQLASWLGILRWNREQLVAVLNEVDLRHEVGNLLLTSAGVVHAIFGLSHQTHPLDGTRTTLQTLLRNGRRLAATGASDAELRALVDAADLPSLRAANRAAPKNEAWLPLMLDGRLTLVEPQQSSDTTWSLADFYTPFVWDGRVRFRKGDPAYGLSADALAETLAAVELGATALSEIRCVPTAVAAGGEQAQLFRLVDDALAWPFFNAYRLDLHGTATAPARWHGDHAPGVFQQLVVLEGDVSLTSGEHVVALGPTAPAFIPATLRGGYDLAATAEASLLMFSVHSLRGARR